ncbi:MAG: DUF2254 domain-containing protein [Humidesulfovibrio sp.]|jgi:uncharacterized membrane protein|uniref:DUF2254 domain-containing protein n=1 Tax=Humidesulfovibrio sp. TaxID=2910988 RepID=UPI002733D511|nr:DUF2254 domain-containing protein [Humidesulfovibrio sp.]MDP2847051.1 DUF2254 domain-containing protein [Humidesulfovibrio sp.]
MAWNRWYSMMSNLRSSIWVVPIISLIAAATLKRLAEKLGGWMVDQGYYDLKVAFFGLNREEAHAFLDRIFSINMACLVFTFGSLLVAIQVAGGQYTPRIIATTLLRDKVIRSIVGLFAFTLLWTNRAMMQLGFDPNVPQLQVFLAGMFGVASLIAFIVLIDYCAKLLRPVSLVGRVGQQGIQAIRNIYPNLTTNVRTPHGHYGKRGMPLPPWRAGGVTAAMSPAVERGPADRTISHAGQSAIVLAVNLQKLVHEAQRADSIIELVPQVGDFVAVDEPLFRVYGNAESIDASVLRTLVAFGAERTIEQDPMFPFRIAVDISLKALSPAINDPTTAVLAIDQLHRLLRQVGERSLHGQEMLDSAGRPRLIFRTPNWEDFVHITFREIRHCGIGNLQVVRRLRAVIENLQQSLPEHRHPALLIELELLDRAAERQYEFPEDLALARIADSQGLGGSSGSSEN